MQSDRENEREEGDLRKDRRKEKKMGGGVERRLEGGGKCHMVGLRHSMSDG